MASSVQDPEVQVQPGQDHPDHTQANRAQIASDLSKIYGVNYQATALAPPREEELSVAGNERLLDQVKTQGGWQEFTAGLAGKSRTDKSGNFMKILKNRLLGQHNRSGGGG